MTPHEREDHQEWVNRRRFHVHPVKKAKIDMTLATRRILSARRDFWPVFIGVCIFMVAAVAALVVVS